MMADVVNLRISSTKSEFVSERRFSRAILVSELKTKLELITGIVATFMELELYDQNNLVACMDSERLLGYYSPQNNWIVHVVDKNPNSKVGEFEDLSKVEKFELDDESYDKRPDSVRNYMKKHKMGKYSDAAKDNDEKVSRREAEEERRAKTFKVGDRCEVTVPKLSQRRGEVKFIGEVFFKPGYWVGIKYDEPLGKNDGSVDGHRYFSCPNKYGGFVRPSQVAVGDFPEDNLSDDDEI